jgi:hypothetical protein
MESASYVSSDGSLPEEIHENIVFKTLFRAGLSPQEAEVWIGRELDGATSFELSNKFQIGEPVASHAYRRARTKTNYLGITRESMLILKKRKSMF